jgi:hypothetical protein
MFKYEDMTLALKHRLVVDQMWTHNLVENNEESVSLFGVFLSHLTCDEINYLLNIVHKLVQEECTSMQYEITWTLAKRLEMLEAAAIKIRAATKSY